MIEVIKVGLIMKTNCYVVFDESTKDAIVIDPGYESTKITDFISDNNLNVKLIYLTHCHFDHILGAEWLKNILNVPIACLDKEESNMQDDEITLGKSVLLKELTLKVDKIFFENDEIEVGNLIFKVIHTPGHTSGSSSLYGEGILISGDTLFKGTYGRSDLATGNLQDLVKTINTKLYELPDDTVVYPGHGESTTIGEEKRNSDY